jgi:dimeric dUTPase (all-alpha-NTP-PPase superfamily)
MKDKLDKMFNLQNKLNERIGIKISKLSSSEKIKWIIKYSIALFQENSELIDTVPWKWWKKKNVFKKNEARMELIDIFHFLISIALMLGLDSKKFFSIYVKKNKINHFRQDSLNKKNKKIK